MKKAVSILALTLALGASAVAAKPFGGHWGQDHNGPQGGWQQGMQQGMGLRMFGELDANSDGFISEDELATRAQTRFDEADADGNGLLSAEEMLAHAEAMRGQMMQEHGNGNGPMTGEGMQDRFAGRGQEMLDRMMDRFDIDDDGQMSFAEMQAARPGLMFDRIDASGDGKISELEWHEAMQHRGGEGPHTGRW